MITINQLCSKKNNKRVQKIKNKLNKPYLNNCPQKMGRCEKVHVRNPKKPNSAMRKCVKVLIPSIKKQALAHIPGEGHNLAKYSKVLIQGKRVRDLPYIRYRVIRNVLDLRAVYDRKRARSKYGVGKNIR